MKAEPISYLKGVQSRISPQSQSQALAVSYAGLSQSAFTRDDLERKNQERVRAYQSGPLYPYGTEYGSNTVAPGTMRPYNSERLNSAEELTPTMQRFNAPYLHDIQSDFKIPAIFNNSLNWSQLARVTTGQANVDSEGFAQTIQQPNYISVGDPSNWTPDVNGQQFGFNINGGGANPGAAFTSIDGAAKGIAGSLVQNQIEQQASFGKTSNAALGASLPASGASNGIQIAAYNIVGL